MNLVSKFPFWKNLFHLFVIKLEKQELVNVGVYVAFSVEIHALAN